MKKRSVVLLLAQFLVFSFSLACFADSTLPRKKRTVLGKAGFTDAYTITDGFEGDKDKNGQRTVNGWKNSGAPWTTKLDPALVYKGL